MFDLHHSTHDIGRRTATLALVLIGWISAAALPGYSHAGPDSSSRPSLTLEERMGYQRAIEEVYWQHRIWPKQNGRRKPDLEEVMPEAAIRAKVEDYLAKSQALAVYWQRPITAEQLQAEMDRMARQTKQPAVIEELWSALGNDPYVIAECLARPTPANRLIRNWYAYDERYHGDLRRRAEGELRRNGSPGQMRNTSGAYRQVRWLRGKAIEARDAEPNTDSVTLNVEEWQAKMSELAQFFFEEKKTSGGISGDGGDATEVLNRLPLGELSQLREGQDNFYVMAVLGKNNEQVQVATLEWKKERFDAWWKRQTEDMDAPPEQEPSYLYRLPAISSGPDTCVDDTWQPTLPPFPSVRTGHTAVWTGSEMIVWGGSGAGFTGFLNTGERYNPATDTWTPTSTTDAPSARTQHTAVWTGSEMLVWGSRSDTGGRYNPATDTWTTTSTTDAPSARVGHTAVWTGREMIVWGGGDYCGEHACRPTNSGGRYDPTSDTWTATSTSNAPSARSFHTAVLTGSELIVWGGLDHCDDDGCYPTNTGGRYNPTTDSWTPTSTTNAPSERYNHAGVSSGSDMIIWGGSYDFCYPDSRCSVLTLNTGGRYNAATNSWVATSTSNAPGARAGHTAVWTGSEMIVWGGGDYCGEEACRPTNSGGRYDPTSDTWTATGTSNAPSARAFHTAVWTASEMIVFGGGTNTGGRFDPVTDTWTPTATNNVPSARAGHTAVWTGTEMIIWGGAFPETDTGGRFDPVTDTWTPTATNNVPSARAAHTAVWTGTEMIVWGGGSGSTLLNTGRRYNPGTDTWTATSTTNAPSARWRHTAVWTGSEMIVWAGAFPPTNTGGCYDPATDTWTATSTVDAPSARLDHTAVWTGTEMIVWGGQGPGVVPLNTGARYDRMSDTWTATATTNTPTPRLGHTAVWTGSEMIVWGGSPNAYSGVDTGGRYNPATDGWTATSTSNAPSPRAGHTAVWTGSEMIVWGGSSQSIFFNTGGRYDSGTDTWTATSTTDAPNGREGDTVVWTGTEMIVWGGAIFAGYRLDSGGRYCASVGTLVTRRPFQ